MKRNKTHKKSVIESESDSKRLTDSEAEDVKRNKTHKKSVTESESDSKRLTDSDEEVKQIRKKKKVKKHRKAMTEIENKRMTDSDEEVKEKKRKIKKHKKDKDHEEMKRRPSRHEDSVARDEKTEQKPQMKIMKEEISKDDFDGGNESDMSDVKDKKVLTMKHFGFSDSGSDEKDELNESINHLLANLVTPNKGTEKLSSLTGDIKKLNFDNIKEENKEDKSAKEDEGESNKMEIDIDNTKQNSIIVSESNVTNTDINISVVEEDDDKTEIKDSNITFIKSDVDNMTDENYVNDSKVSINKTIDDMKEIDTNSDDETDNQISANHKNETDEKGKASETGVDATRKQTYPNDMNCEYKERVKSIETKKLFDAKTALKNAKIESCFVKLMHFDELSIGEKILKRKYVSADKYQRVCKRERFEAHIKFGLWSQSSSLMPSKLSVDTMERKKGLKTQDEKKSAESSHSEKKDSEKHREKNSEKHHMKHKRKSEARHEEKRHSIEESQRKDKKKQITEEKAEEHVHGKLLILSSEKYINSFTLLPWQELSLNLGCVKK